MSDSSAHQTAADFPLKPLMVAFLQQEEHPSPAHVRKGLLLCISTAAKDLKSFKKKKIGGYEVLFILVLLQSMRAVNDLNKTAR